MSERQGILLTGATGTLGQYLLRDLLVRGYSVTVLVRDSKHLSAADRIAAIINAWSDRLGERLPSPIVIAADLATEGLRLTSADRRWLQRHCRIAIHSAASLAFKQTADGDPWHTNVDGTQSLLALSRELGLTEWHHVSTAFVCGRHTGLVREDDDGQRTFHNPYEASKFEAERLVRDATGIRATVYRPAIIVGDSVTGHTTTFNGLYRFLELAVRLASRNSDADGRCLPLRLPLTGDETWNLVPVDWVSRAIVEILAAPQGHGRTYHLVSRTPITTRFIHDVGARELQVHGVEFASRENVASPTGLEEMFLAGIHEYWPYLHGNPVFDCTNTATALPHLPSHVIDESMLKRLIAFAVTSHWGRADRGGKFATCRSVNLDPATPQHYIEHTFPEQARRSTIARTMGLDVTVGIDLRGPGGGQWSCIWRHGELTCVTRGLTDRADVVYHTDTATFHAIVNGLQSPQQAFFEERIEISGALETALKLAALFEHFLSDHSSDPPRHTEVMDASACPS